MRLQFFADPGGNGGGPEGGDDNGAGTGTVSFDDFLAQEGNQAEFDRRVQKAVNTAVGRHRRSGRHWRMTNFPKRKNWLK